MPNIEIYGYDRNELSDKERKEMKNAIHEVLTDQQAVDTVVNFVWSDVEPSDPTDRTPLPFARLHDTEPHHAGSNIVRALHKLGLGVEVAARLAGYFPPPAKAK